MILGTAPHHGPSPAIRSGRGGTSISPSALLLTPIKIDFGASSPLLLDGRFDRRGFLMHFGGRRIARQACSSDSFAGICSRLDCRRCSLSGRRHSMYCCADPGCCPLDDYGDDRPSLASTPTGTITLQDASLETPYLSAPLLIKTAPSFAFWIADCAGAGLLRSTGQCTLPATFARRCRVHRVRPCVRQFDLTVPSLDLATLPGVMVGNNALVQAILQRIEKWRHGDPVACAAWHDPCRNMRPLGTLTMNDAVATLDIGGCRDQDRPRSMRMPSMEHCT